MRYAPLFVQGKDTYTGEDVGALFNFDLGWGIGVQPARDPALDRWLSKHLVVRLTNAVTTLDVCVVHLRRAIGAEGITKQQQQTEALKIWANQHLKENPRANLVILGDFNETKKPGDASAALAPLVQPAGPLVDTFALSNLKPKTHTNGKAYDRILISPALTNGASDLKFSALTVQAHPNGKGKIVAAWTDHFPLTAAFSTK
jgi:endonuclease/exonuclease/phosphatase family metal-dependent hydrolase